MEPSRIRKQEDILLGISCFLISKSYSMSAFLKKNSDTEIFFSLRDLLFG